VIVTRFTARESIDGVEPEHDRQPQDEQPEADVADHIDDPAADREQPGPLGAEHPTQHRGREQRTGDQPRTLTPAVHPEAEPGDRADHHHWHEGQRSDRQPSVPLSLEHGQRTTADSAASTTLLINIARFIGTTPPGFGERYPATSLASSATSPVS